MNPRAAIKQFKIGINNKSIRKKNEIILKCPINLKESRKRKKREKRTDETKRNSK